MNEVRLWGMGAEQVAAILRQAGQESIRIVVARPVDPSVPNYMVRSMTKRNFLTVLWLDIVIVWNGWMDGCPQGRRSAKREEMAFYPSILLILLYPTNDSFSALLKLLLHDYTVLFVWEQESRFKRLIMKRIRVCVVAPQDPAKVFATPPDTSAIRSHPLFLLRS